MSYETFSDDIQMHRDVPLKELTPPEHEMKEILKIGTPEEPPAGVDFDTKWKKTANVKRNRYIKGYLSGDYIDKIYAEVQETSKKTGVKIRKFSKFHKTDDERGLAQKTIAPKNEFFTADELAGVQEYAR